MGVLQPLGLFLLAALFEIGGCFAFWAWLRLGRSPWLAAPGVLSLVLFAWTLTRVESAFAGRAYAAYGGIYIVSSVLWLSCSRGRHPIAGISWARSCASQEPSSFSLDPAED